MTAIANRMKFNYERPARHELIRRMPVIVRVDGKAFHTYTRPMDRPFDSNIVKTMVYAAECVVNEMQGCKAAYVQSDEASFFATDYDTLQTEPWLGYIKSKVETISASVMTAAFNQEMGLSWGAAHFDARSFNIPREEVANYFLWRMMDWERNSVSMYCRAHFSHKQMDGQGKADQHEMLHSIGKNWATDLPEQLRNGTWVFPGNRRSTSILPKYESIAKVLDPLIHCDASPKP